MDASSAHFILSHMLGPDGLNMDLDEARKIALDDAIDALDKQIPRVAKEFNGEYYCAPCVMKLPKKNGNYCPCCGHRMYYPVIPNKEENNESQSLEQSGEIQSGESGDELQNSEGLEA